MLCCVCVKLALSIEFSKEWLPTHALCYYLYYKVGFGIGKIKRVIGNHSFFFFFFFFFSCVNLVIGVQFSTQSRSSLLFTEHILNEKGYFLLFFLAIHTVI